LEELCTQKNTEPAQPTIEERNSKARRSYNNRVHKSFICKYNKRVAQSKIGK
jgi:hypothetical protein